MRHYNTCDKIVDITDLLHVDAFNAAFHELGLPWYWDVQFYRSLDRRLCEKTRVKEYLRQRQPHMLRGYGLDPLAEMIYERKESRYAVLLKQGPSGVDWAAVQEPQVGI